SIRHIRNLLIAKISGADSELITEPSDQRPRLAAQAENFSEEDLTRFFQILMVTDEDLRRKPDPRLHLELGLLRLVNAARLAPLEQVLSDLRAEKLPAAASASRNSAATPAPASRSSAAPQNATPSEKMHAAAASASVATPLNATAAAPVAPSIAPPNFPPADNAEKLSPVPAAPPRIVAKAAEKHFSGLADAQMETIQSLLRTQQKFLWSMVEHATRWELNGSEMNLYFPAENRSLADILQGRETMEKLRNILSSVIGQQLRVCVKLDSSRTAPPRLSDLRARVEQDPVVRAMLERFGGKISEVKQRSEDGNGSQGAAANDVPV